MADCKRGPPGRARFDSISATSTPSHASRPGKAGQQAGFVDDKSFVKSTLGHTSGNTI